MVPVRQMSASLYDIENRPQRLLNGVYSLRVSRPLVGIAGLQR